MSKFYNPKTDQVVEEKDLTAEERKELGLPALETKPKAETAKEETGSTKK